MRWFGVYAGMRYPRTQAMPGRHWGWDVVCACGWDSQTGGATQASVRRAIDEHLLIEHGIGWADRRRTA